MCCFSYHYCCVGVEISLWIIEGWSEDLPLFCMNGIEDGRLLHTIYCHGSFKLGREDAYSIKTQSSKWLFKSLVSSFIINHSQMKCDIIFPVAFQTRTNRQHRVSFTASVSH